VQVQAEYPFACCLQDHPVLATEPLEHLLESLALGNVANDTREQPFAILVCFTKRHFDWELATVAP
jgi:hypothetical protein